VDRKEEGSGRTLETLCVSVSVGVAKKRGVVDVGVGVGGGLESGLGIYE